MNLLQPFIWYFRIVNRAAERAIEYGDRCWVPVMVTVRVATFLAWIVFALGPVLLIRDGILAATGLDIFGGVGDLGRECPYRYC